MNSPLDGFDVMVLEDDEDSRSLFEFVLEQSGATVRSVVTAEEAMAALQARCPDLLLADISMPGEDGYAFIRRAHLLHPNLAAIAVTGRAGPVDVKRALDAGYLHHLAKPVDIDGLVASVFRFASRAAAPAKGRE